MSILTSRPPRKCSEPGCFNIGNWAAHRGRCPNHDRREQSRPLEKLYRQKSWLGLFRPRYLGLNPICLKIENGIRCAAPATELHHLREPKTPAEFFDPKNVVGLCKHHHSGQQGTPLWREGVDYAPVHWSAPSLGREQD